MIVKVRTERRENWWDVYFDIFACDKWMMITDFIRPNDILIQPSLSGVSFIRENGKQFFSMPAGAKMLWLRLIEQVLEKLKEYFEMTPEEREFVIK